MERVWEFNTKRFTVALEIMPEELDPADSFSFQDDIDAVRNGEVEWFCAAVVVYLDGVAIGSDVLGGCAYKTVREFHTAHRDPDSMNRNCTIFRAAKGENHVICHYFPSMVSQAIAAARTHLDDIPKLRATA
jgi:hypothetical protein